MKLKFIDLFAGIGGFHLAFKECGTSASDAIKIVAEEMIKALT